MNRLETLWEIRLESLDIAFQPIVSIHTGKIYAVEALLRGAQEIGFSSIHALFDQAYLDNELYRLDLQLREKAIRKFTAIKSISKLKLFFNLDNRLLEMADFQSNNTAKLLKKYGLEKEVICFEISERHEIIDTRRFEELMAHYAQEGYMLALDDFGVGYAGYKLLYQSTPDVIKIDRFFIDAIEQDQKKKILVRNMVQLATQLGVIVIAEGVETEAELLLCRELGCHLVQGYIVQKPTCDISQLCAKYKHIHTLIKEDRRHHSLKKLVKTQLEIIEAANINDEMIDILERFKQNKRHSFVPVVDNSGIPMGVVHERSLQSFVYSSYGRSLLLNVSTKSKKLKKFIQKFPIADIHTDIETLVELFSHDEASDGILITNNMRYVGFLSARSIIKLINERNLASARDQNPLTLLPGNYKIDEFIEKAIAKEKRSAMCYLDFDYFKPYNDKYGFRNGDRVIQLFADILKKKLPKHYFKGHIGGDDFFIGIEQEDLSCEVIYSEIRSLTERFKRDVQEFYSERDRELGYIISKDREGHTRRFEMLSVSAVIVMLDSHNSRLNSDELQRQFVALKSEAKRSSNHISAVCLL